MPGYEHDIAHIDLNKTLHKNLSNKLINNKKNLGVNFKRRDFNGNANQAGRSVDLTIEKPNKVNE